MPVGPHFASQSFPGSIAFRFARRFCQVTGGEFFSELKLGFSQHLHIGNVCLVIRPSVGPIISRLSVHQVDALNDSCSSLSVSLLYRH